MTEKTEDALDDIIDRIYSVVVEPEQLDELVQVWRSRVGSKVSHSASAQRMDAHLQRAADLIVQFNTNASKPENAGRDTHSQPIFRIDDGDCIVVCNPATSQVYGLTVGDNLDKLPLYAESRRALKHLLSKVRSAQQVEGKEAAIVRLIRSDNEEAIIVSVDPAVGERGAVEIRTAEIVCPPEILAVLESTFGLTQAETGVAQHLIEGAGINDIAAMRNNSVGTVRVHVRSLFAKTETHSQAEFIRMAIGLAFLVQSNGSYAGASDGYSADTPYPRAEHRHTLTLPDGRLLAYAMFGPEDGRTVLFLHDNILGDTWPAGLADEAARRNLRVIAPARPHYSESSPHLPHQHPLDQFTEDALLLLDKLGIERYVVMSRTTGSAFAGALALADQKRCRGMLALSPALPVDETKDYEGLNDYARFVALAARFQLQGLLFACRAGEAIYRKAGARRYLKTVLARSKPDRALCDDPVNLPALQHGLDFQKDYRAFYHELARLQSHKLPHFLELPCPVNLMMGELDTNNRLQRAEELVRIGASFEITVVPAAGALFFYSHGQKILDAVDKLYQAQSDKG